MQVGLACRLKPQRLSNPGELVHVSQHADTPATTHLFNPGLLRLNHHPHHISSSKDDKMSLEAAITADSELPAWGAVAAPSLSTWNEAPGHPRTSSHRLPSPCPPQSMVSESYLNAVLPTCFDSTFLVALASIPWAIPMQDDVSYWWFLMNNPKSSDLSFKAKVAVRDASIVHCHFNALETSCFENWFFSGENSYLFKLFHLF